MKFPRRSANFLISVGLSLITIGGAVLIPSMPGFVQTVGTKAYPPEFMTNVKTVYGAKGDGVTDDTAAIQAALADGRTIDQDYNGRPKALYFPAGTYLVSDKLEWNGCCLTLQGQGKGVSIIKLKNNAVGYADVNTPKAVIKTPGGNMSFRQNISELTVNTGRNNPGAIGIDYISSNIGTVNNVTIRSEDGRGKAGLDMSRQWPGPCLIKNVQVNGFNYGIYTKHAEYGPTFENITLVGQKVAGIRNEGNTLAIRRLKSTNTVPAVENQESFGSVIILNGTLQGGSAAVSAITNNGYLYARNLVTSSYQSAVRNKGVVIPGLSKSEYISDRVYSLFDSPKRSLNLPIENTPSSHDNNMVNWGRFTARYYGDTENLQSLLNSGKSTIYFPHGTYFTFDRRVVTVPATVKRIIGFSSGINVGPDDGGIVFRVEENSDQPLIIEQFGYGVSVEQASARTVAIKHGAYRYSDFPTAGKLFLEDVALVALNMNHTRNVWARQLNIESLDAPRTKILNKGGSLWILGLKTEGKGTVIDTSLGGKTEMLGTLIYPVQGFSLEDKRQAAFINTNSSQSLIYSLSVYGANRNYAIQVEETRNGVKRQLLSEDMPGRMPLFTGF